MDNGAVAGLKVEGGNVTVFGEIGIGSVKSR